MKTKLLGSRNDLFSRLDLSSTTLSCQDVIETGEFPVLPCQDWEGRHREVFAPVVRCPLDLFV